MTLMIFFQKISQRSQNSKPDYYLTYDGSGSNPADPEVLCTNCYHHFDQSGSGCGFPPEWIRGKHQTWWEASIFGS